MKASRKRRADSLIKQLKVTSSGILVLPKQLSGQQAADAERLREAWPSESGLIQFTKNVKLKNFFIFKAFFSNIHTRI